MTSRSNGYRSPMPDAHYGSWPRERRDELAEEELPKGKKRKKGKKKKRKYQQPYVIWERVFYDGDVPFEE